MSHHKVETYHWVENVIRKTIYFFERIEEALNFAKHSMAHDVKVFNEIGELVHHKNPGHGHYA